MPIPPTVSPVPHSIIHALFPPLLIAVMRMFMVLVSLLQVFYADSELIDHQSPEVGTEKQADHHD